MNCRQIPMVELVHNYKAIRKQLLKALDEVLLSGKYILGPKVAEFENATAQFLGTGYGIGVNSGTDALKIALKASGLAPNDEVITTPFTFVATAEIITEIGARPVFVDIEPMSYNINASLIEASITERTKAILVVHLFGQPCDMPPIAALCKRHGLLLIEDVAQAFGSKVDNQYAGTFGDVGCFSFYPTKNLFSFGDAGLITTNDALLAEKCKLYRNHGIRQNYESDFLGYNSRLDSLHAAILLAFLPHVTDWNNARRELVSVYKKYLDSVPGIETPYEQPRTEHVYNLFTIRVKNDKRNALKQSLASYGISTNVYYPIPLHLSKAFAYLNHKPGNYPEAERASHEVLSLPLWTTTPKSAIRYICRTIKTILKSL